MCSRMNNLCSIAIVPTHFLPVTIAIVPTNFLPVTIVCQHFRLLNHLFFAMSFAVVCFIATKSLLLTCLVPLAVLCARYYYSRRVVLGYLERAKLTDMGDIEGHYMKTPGNSFGGIVF